MPIVKTTLNVLMYTILVLCNISTISETLESLLQIIGKNASSHSNFIMTGSFDNPGPFGGFIAIMLAILGSYVLLNRNIVKWYDKALIALSVISCALCIIVLPASMSRAAWLALGVAALVLGLKELNLADWIRKHKRSAIITSVLVLMVMTGVFFIKKDSAIGRLHIWNIELRAIADKPWTGHGKGSVLGVYGETQAEYFAEKDRLEIIKKVAGCPEYAFNEYLKIGVEYGIPTMFAVIAMLIVLIILLLKVRSPFAYGLIAFCVFAFFSYPLSVVKIKSEAEKQWESVRFLSGMEAYEDAVEEYAPLYEDLKDNYRYLYDYGYALYKCGRHEESNNFLKEGSRISSDPMFYNIMGRNNEALGLYEAAEYCYTHSHNMVPSRIYPLSLLMKMKIRTGATQEAIAIGEKIQSMHVNDKVLTMRRIQKECLVQLDSLRNLTYEL